MLASSTVTANMTLASWILTDGITSVESYSNPPVGTSPNTMVGTLVSAWKETGVDAIDRFPIPKVIGVISIGTLTGAGNRFAARVNEILCAVMGTDTDPGLTNIPLAIVTVAGAILTPTDEGATEVPPIASVGTTRAIAILADAGRIVTASASTSDIVCVDMATEAGDTVDAIESAGGSVSVVTATDAGDTVMPPTDSVGATVDAEMLTGLGARLPAWTTLMTPMTNGIGTVAGVIVIAVESVGAAVDAEIATDVGDVVNPADSVGVVMGSGTATDSGDTVDAADRSGAAVARGAGTVVGDMETPATDSVDGTVDSDTTIGLGARLPTRTRLGAAVRIGSPTDEGDTADTAVSVGAVLMNVRDTGLGDVVTDADRAGGCVET